MKPLSEQATIVCSQCGQKLMPAMVRCRDCGTPIQRNNTALTNKTTSNSHQILSEREQEIFSGGTDMTDMLAMAENAEERTDSDNFSQNAPVTIQSFNFRKPHSVSRPAPVEATPSRVARPVEPPTKNSTDMESEKESRKKRVEKDVICLCGRTVHVEDDVDCIKTICPYCESRLTINGNDLIVEANPNAEEKQTAKKKVNYKKIAQKFAAKQSLRQTQKSLRKKTLAAKQLKRIQNELADNDSNRPAQAKRLAEAIQKLGQSNDPRAFALIEEFVADESLTVRNSVANALGQLSDPEAIPLLIRMLGEASLEVHQSVIRSLAEKENPETILPLLLSCQGNPQLKALVYQTITQIGKPGLPNLIQYAEGTDKEFAIDAIVLLGRLGSQKAVEPLLVLLQSDSRKIKQAAVEALGSIRSPKVLPFLRELVTSEDREIRFSVVKAFGDLGDRRSIPQLMKCLKDPDSSIRRRALISMGDIQDPRPVSALASLINDSSDDFRSLIAEALGKIGSPESIPPLLRLLDDPHETVRLKAVTSFRRLKTPEAIPQLLLLLRDPNDKIRQRAVEALGAIGDPQSTVPLIHILKLNRSELIRAAAAKSLGEIGDFTAIGPLKDALHDEFIVRCKAINALGAIGHSDALSGLLAMLKEPAPEIRYHACQALGEIGQENTIRRLEMQLDDDDSLVKRSAAKALEKITGNPAEKILAERNRFSNRLKRSSKSTLIQLAPSFLWGLFGFGSLLGKAITATVLLSVALVAGIFLLQGNSSSSAEILLRGNVETLAFNPDGSRLAVGRTRNLVEIWDIEKNERTHVFQANARSTLVFSNDSLITAGGGELSVWNFNEGQPQKKRIPGFSQRTKWVQTGPDERTMVFQTLNGKTEVWSFSPIRKLFDIPLPAAQISGCAIGPGSSGIVVATAQKTLLLFDPLSGKKTRQIPAPRFKSSIITMAFNAEGTQLAAASSRGELAVLDLKSGKILHVHQGIIPAKQLKFLPSGSGLYILRESQFMHWDFASDEITQFPVYDADTFSAFAVNRTGTSLVVGGTDNSEAWVLNVQQSKIEKTLDLEE